MIKVAALVLNSVSKDARVLKEAKVLAKSNFEITIFGEVDLSLEKQFEKIQENFYINRVLQPLHFSILNDEKKIKKYPKLVISFLRKSKKILKLLVYPFTVYKYLRKEKYEIIHCHDLPALLVAFPYFIFNKKVKVIYDSHEIFEEMAGKSKLIKPFIFFLQYILSYQVDCFITINQSISDYLTKKYPGLPKGVIVMNAIDYNQAPKDYDYRLHDAAKLDHSKKILLYQGGFSAHRSLDEIVDVAQTLDKNWAIVFMGWGDYEKNLKAYALTIDPNLEKIRFIPPALQSELALWTMGASIGIIPYKNNCLNHYYCTPNKLWEYPAARVPILSTNLIELKKYIEEFKIGKICAEISGKEISKVINSLTDNEINEMKTNCDHFIKENSWSKFAQNLSNAYSELASQK